MRVNDLPSLHTFITNGFALTREATKAINQVKVYNMRTGEVSAAAAKLKAFFEACVVAVDTVGPGAKDAGVPAGKMAARSVAAPVEDPILTPEQEAELAAEFVAPVVTDAPVETAEKAAVAPAVPPVPKAVPKAK